MPVIDENQKFEGTKFTPFNDTNRSAVERIGTVNTPVSATLGYDTSKFDSLRQGVELRTRKHVYNSTQPKLWSGNIDHFILIRTLGQARSFTEFDDSSKFIDNQKFNPAQYIEDNDYPSPIKFNEGPQQEEEASIEPLTIPFRKPNIEGRHPFRAIKGSLEDGNNFDNEDLSTTRVEQFAEFSSPLIPRFFLDEGQQYFGSGTINAIIVEGFTPIIQREINPFDETKDERIVDIIQTSDSDFISALKALDFDLDNDIRGEFDKKSMPAGGDVYGPDAARAGTDSIVYRNTARGA